MIQIAPSETNVIAPESFDYDFQVESYNVNELGESGDTITAVNDLVFQQFQESVRRRFAAIVFQQAGKGFSATFESSDNSVAEVDNEGVVRSVANGEANIYCQIRSLKKVAPFTALVDQLSAQDSVIGYVEGSLGDHISSETYGRLASSVQYNMFSSGTNRNQNMWASDLDWTGVSYRDTTKENGGTIRTTAAISRRHVLFATHASPGNNSIIVYVGSDNQTLQRVMTGQVAVGADLSVGVLDEDLPESITHYRIMPANWTDYLTARNELQLPTIHVTRSRQVRIRWRTNGAGFAFTAPEATASHRLADVHSYELRQGDSSNPYFHLIGGELILIGSNSTINGGATPSGLITQINAAMASLGGGYSLDTIDLSGFPNYGNV